MTGLGPFKKKTTVSGVTSNKRTTQTVPPMRGVPDCDGKRYCRACKAFLSLEDFDKTGPKRFYCSPHMRTLFRTRGTKETAVVSLRQRLQRDLALLFRTDSLYMPQADLLDLVAQAGKTPEDYRGLCLLPVDPRVPVTAGNAFIATKEQRKYLTALYQMTGDAYEYVRGVATVRAGFPTRVSSG